MRKILFSTVALSSLSFSFYRFEGPYVILGRQGLQVRGFTLGERVPYAPVVIPQDIMNHKTGSYDLPFLWEPNTKSFILTSPLAYNNYNNGNQNVSLIKAHDKDPIYDFLKCNFEYNPERFWKLSNLVNYESLTSGRNYGPLLFISNTGKDINIMIDIDKIYSSINRMKENSLLIKTFYSTEGSQKEKLLLNDKEYILSNNIDAISKNTYSVIRLERRLTASGNKIDIVNEKDGVKLYKKDKHGKIIRAIDLKGALLNYYNNDYFLTTEFATRLKIDKKGDKNFDIQPSTIAWAVTQFDHPILKQKDHDLLLNSTILAVWHVRAETFNPKRYFYEEERKESYYFNRPVYTTLVGLARDNRTGAVFHWVTELGRDIEVLFSLESSSQSLTRDQSIQTDSMNVELGDKKRRQESDAASLVSEVKSLKIEGISYGYD